MKKLIAGLLAAFLMSAGLVAATSVSSSASCARPNYPGACFDTRTGLTVQPNGDGPKRRTFTATVRPVGTTARPAGVFVFRFKRVGGGAQFATRSVPTASGKVTLTRKFNNPGVWNVTVTFQSKDNGIFRSSKSGNRQFRVGR